MDIPLIAAKVLGIYLVVSGLFLIFRGKTVPYMLKDFFGHPAIVYLAGVILVFLSSLYLLQNNVWDGSWQTIVTLIVWFALIKGLLYILAPQILERMANKKILKSTSALGIVAVATGAYLFFLG